MAKSERIVSTVLHVVESKDSLERVKADLAVSDNKPISSLLKKKKDKDEEKDEDSERDD